MNLDACTVVVRERTIPEIYDLAIVLGRRHAMKLLPLVLIAAAPWIALDWWLLNGMSWVIIYPLFLLMCAQAPLVTSPITAYLGEAMFEPRASARAALRMALSRWRPLLLVGILRGLAAVIPFLLLYFPPHLVEVLLLERQPFGSAWKRAHAMASDWRTEHGSHSLIGLLLIVVGHTVAIVALYMLIEMLVWGFADYDDIIKVLDPGSSPLPLLLLWLLVAYLAVVRFLAYIDLRTRHEGWDVELALRRAARRIEPEAA